MPIASTWSNPTLIDNNYQLNNQRNENLPYSPRDQASVGPVDVDWNRVSDGTSNKNFQALQNEKMWKIYTEFKKWNNQNIENFNKYKANEVNFDRDGNDSQDIFVKN